MYEIALRTCSTVCSYDWRRLHRGAFFTFLFPLDPAFRFFAVSVVPPSCSVPRVGGRDFSQNKTKTNKQQHTLTVLPQVPP